MNKSSILLFAASFLILSLVIFYGALLPGKVSAVDNVSNEAAQSYVSPAGGLVNCGTGASGSFDCNFKKLLELIDSVLKFFMYAIIFPVAIIMIIYAGGTMVFYASSNPGKAKGAKIILFNVVIGFGIIFASYAFVQQVFSYFVDGSGPLKSALEVVFGS